MSLAPSDWTVVVNGRWNPFILTPRGIAKRVFGLAEGAVVHVKVPLDDIYTYRVSNPDQTISAVADQQQLKLFLESPSWKILEEARLMAVNAMTSLPETPVSAVGYNIRFRSATASPQELEMLSSEASIRLQELPFDNLAGRTLAIALQWKGGVINVHLNHIIGVALELNCNFHQSSTDRGLLEQWLKIPIADVRTVSSLISKKLGITVPEDYQ